MVHTLLLLNAILYLSALDSQQISTLRQIRVMPSQLLEHTMQLQNQYREASYLEHSQHLLHYL
jgi:hypothetical protein